MPEQDFEYMTVLERYRYFVAEGCEPMVSATLVLAAAVQACGFAANMNDDTGHINIRMTGDIETSSKA